MSTRQRLSSGTIVTRKSRFRIFYTWFRGQSQDLNAQTIENFFYYLQTVKKLSNTSLNTYLSTLISLKKYLFDRGMKDDFLEGFKPFLEEDPEIDPLDKNELEILLSVECQTRNKDLTQTLLDITVFLAHTGARWEDGQALVCRNVDPVGQKVSYVQKKNRKLRVVYILEPLYSILMRRIKNKEPGEHVFTNSVGGMLHYPDVHSNLRKRAQQAGIKKTVSPHVLRHSYAQALYNQTKNLYLVKDVLGQKDIKSTERYAKNSDERIRTAQMTHPFIEKSLDIRFRIEQAERTIRELSLERDGRFDPRKVRRAIHQFTEELHHAIQK